MALNRCVAPTWKDFVEQVHHLGTNLAGDSPSFLFRGQADDSWPLRPAFNRLLPENCSAEAALALEKAGLQAFQQTVWNYASQIALPEGNQPEQLFEWWALMQHHGAPTRLLDWTESPYVAAYFAVERLPEVAGAIYVSHPWILTAAVRNKAPNGFPPKRLVTTECEPHLIYSQPVRHSARSAAQQGYFSFSTYILGDHLSLMQTSTDIAVSEGAVAEAIPCIKIVIPAERKPEFLARLRQMNITATSLFPGLDGLGRGIAEFLSLKLAAVGET